ncbi:MAG TPA: undecaprenyl-diphosphate phosphatase [Firmicutes bacterium]|nr:undecaprenyl-diphosphate phosphatase [Bacillota bacterium]
MGDLTFFELLKVVVIGIIQGITEWLPISSTGHMILAEELLKLNVSDEFMEMFRVVIQFGSILAVVVLYFRKLNPFALSKSKAEKRDTWTLWFKVLVGIIPAGVVGVLLDDWLDEHLYNYVTVAAALIVYGILFIVIEKRNKNRSLPTKTLSELTYKKSLAIGAFQMLSLIPGTSRSGSTIIGASILGCERPVAAEFSFFMAIPVMLGASLLKLVKFGFDFTSTELIVMAVGVVTAFVVSIAAIKFLMDYIRKRDFSVFGWYRIVLGIIVLIWFAVRTFDA